MKSKTLTRLISGLAVFAMALTLMPAVPAKAEDTASPETDFTWDGTVITGYTGNGGDVVLPEKTTGIGNYAFRDKNNITSVTISKNVANLGVNAFSDCDSLSKVTIAGHLLTKDFVFPPFSGDSALKTIEFADPEITTIPKSLFQDVAGLENVTIPDSVTTIGSYAFCNCTSLKEITLSSSLTSLGIESFTNCPALTKITFRNNAKDGLHEGTDFGLWAFLPTNAANLTVYGYEGAGADTLVEKQNKKNNTNIKFSSLGKAVSPEYESTGTPFTNPNNKSGDSYEWRTRIADNAEVVFKNGEPDSNEFISDGEYTYYVQADGTVMKDRLTYHPDGEHIIYFDGKGHEVFNTFAHPTYKITQSGNEPVADGDQYYFNMFGYMYKNTVTYDATGTKLYYIDGYGCMQHNGWFKFDPDAGYGDTPGAKWSFTGSYIGFANYDGALLTNASTVDFNGTPCYMQGNGEAAY